MCCGMTDVIVAATKKFEIVETGGETAGTEAGHGKAGLVHRSEMKI